MKKKTGLLLGILLVAITITVGVTYALWQVTLQQSSSNVITTGCFNVTLEEGDAIALNNAYPMSDEERKSGTPYTFTIKNNCAEKASYVLNLETVSSGDKVLSDGYVKASLKNGDTELFLSTLNSSHENTEKVITEASKAYKLAEGILQANEEKTFELRLWMDENTPAIDEAMNASYMGKITVSSSYVPTLETENMMVAMSIKNYYDGNGYNFDYNATFTQEEKYIFTLKKIVFQNEINPYPQAKEVIDFSVNQDKSVMGYYVLNTKESESEEDSYTLYIQANGKIKMNYNGSYYFFFRDDYENSEILGIENIDTSLTTDMREMFRGWDFTELDLSHFDTRNVTNMSSMFYGANQLTSLDLTPLDTSKVTDMSNMFSDMSGLTSLNLSNLDTRNVTDMRAMFSEMYALTSLDLSHFNTSKVTDMWGLFRGMSSITSLDVSHFDTSNVTNMSQMFSDVSGLTSLNLSNLDTRNVTDMSSMFSGMSVLTTLDLSLLDTSKVTSMQSMFLEDSQLTNITYGDSFVRKNDSDITFMFSNCPANKPTHSSWEGVTWE